MAESHNHGPDPVFVVNNEPNAITFVCSGDEMLKCSSEGFWVRGQLVNQDDKEAQTVYNSFKQWLAYQQLSR